MKPDDLMISGAIVLIIWPWPVVAAACWVPWPYSIAASISTLTIGAIAWVVLGYLLSSK